MTKVSVFAPAKINLTLHITGQRSDGYHEIDSLVTFAPVGDTLVVTDGNTLSLTVEGPEAEGVPADKDNLILKVAEVLRLGQGTSFTLTKNLPVSSGIGGGSSDAAAATRACMALQDHTEAELLAFGPQILLDTRYRPVMTLGADIPMCLLPAPLRARGIGHQIDFTPLPPLPAILVNPRQPVSTAAAFSALENRDNAPMPETMPAFEDAGALTRWLASQRNDLEAPARAIAPIIGSVLDALASSEGCKLARMSGSGATCFGLYPDAETAQSAGRAIREAQPDWWVAGGLLGDMTARAMPKIT